MRLDRRTFLRRSATAAASLPWLGACARLPWLDDGPGPFRHGVASGDPLSDRVILWTRVTPPPDAPRSIPVRWVVAEQPDLGDVVASGSLVAGPTRDYTVKVDVDGLEPGRSYYYRFDTQGGGSPVGHTRTLPTGSPDKLRLAFCSCSSHAWGYFHGYRLIARRAELDAVLHLGDYIYEHANGTYGDGTSLGRIPEPDKETVSLADYRTRYAQYRRDPDLQEVHRQHPFIAIWDDHELANNAWRGGAQNHQPDEGPWRERRDNALRAYLEWMPIREVEAGRVGHGWRHFRFGDLADLLVLETRLERDRQVESPSDRAALGDARRSILGARQEAWLLERLSASRRDDIAWRLLGQQVMFTPLRDREGLIYNPDAWDGYPFSRERILGHLARERIRDNVVLTGDVHSSWAMDVARDPYSDYDPRSGRGSLAVEFVTPGITAPYTLDREEAERLAREAVENHPHVRWAEFFHRGYALLDVDRGRAQCEWYHLDTVTEPRRAERLAGAYRTWRGADHLEPAREASFAGHRPPDLAP